MYLSLDVDVFDEKEDAVARWNGHCEFEDGSPPEMGRDFLDANDAVTWWRERGATRILVRLDFGKHLWAGAGPPPDVPSKLSVFDPNDPRGRPEGAAKTSKDRRRDFADVVSARRRAFTLDEGRRLTRRREAIHLSVTELAIRVGQSEQWLLDAESGKLSDEVKFSQWVDLVWATRPGWPGERRASKTQGASWVAHQGQYLREAEVLVNSVLGLYD
ncbi:MAG: hypothetical protein JWM55_1321 [Acidimicrobiaceae bacterium]|nr:hypothetical protein [Acidimicrobiaceae bacterium]